MKDAESTSKTSAATWGGSRADGLGLNLSCCSYHFSEREGPEDWNQVNPGLTVDYARGHLQAVAGVFRNSMDRNSWLIGVGPRLAIGKRWEFSAPVGLVSGYLAGNVFILPTIGVRPKPNAPFVLNLHVLPPPAEVKNTSGAVALSVQVWEWQL